jgi:hypothetical protein
MSVFRCNCDLHCKIIPILALPFLQNYRALEEKRKPHAAETMTKGPDGFLHCGGLQWYHLLSGVRRLCVVIFGALQWFTFCSHLFSFSATFSSDEQSAQP